MEPPELREGTEEEISAVEEAAAVEERRELEPKALEETASAAELEPGTAAALEESLEEKLTKAAEEELPKTVEEPSEVDEMTLAPLEEIPAEVELETPGAEPVDEEDSVGAIGKQLVELAKEVNPTGQSIQ